MGLLWNPGGRGRSRPPWRDASGAGDLWRLCQDVYMATIPTRLGGVGGAAVPTSGAVGGCGVRRPSQGPQFGLGPNMPYGCTSMDHGGPGGRPARLAGRLISSPRVDCPTAGALTGARSSHQVGSIRRSRPSSSQLKAPAREDSMTQLSLPVARLGRRRVVARGRRRPGVSTLRTATPNDS
jgi:hypothetical protein